ncbi:MAG: substrate-binding domain-containing protein [Succinivibrionaceae bacterium]|nr:substrate-binding domain-containing protein [Succinivibrionaceae bacterium]
MSRRCLAALAALALPAAALADPTMVFLHHMDDTFTGLSARAFEDYASAEGVEIEIYDAHNEAVLQVEQCVKALREHPGHTIIIKAKDGEVARQVIEVAKKYDTNVIFFNHSPGLAVLEQFDNAWYVDSDPKRAGTEQAKAILELLAQDDQVDRNHDRQLSVMILKGTEGNIHTVQRTKGFMDAMATSQYKVKVEKMVGCDWDGGCAFQETLRALDERGDDLEAIIANNDAMALGAASAVREQGPRHGYERLPIVGVDAIDEAVRAVAAGEMLMTVDFNLPLNVKVAMTLAKALDEGRDLVTDEMKGVTMSSEYPIFYVDTRPIKIMQARSMVREQR